MGGTDASRAGTHPRHALDENLLTPVRFSLMAALGRNTEIDFPTLRDLLEASDSVLSKSIAHLNDIGYVKVRKGFVGNRPRTWVRASPKGIRAFASHIDALGAIVTFNDSAQRSSNSLGSRDPGHRKPADHENHHGH